jgi:hypothetical protein
MTDIAGPDFITLLVSKLEASYKFYKEQIGLTGPLSNKSPKSLRQGQRQLSQWGRWLHLLVRCSRDNQ